MDSVTCSSIGDLRKHRRLHFLRWFRCMRPELFTKRIQARCPLGLRPMLSVFRRCRMPYTIRKQGEKYCVYGPSGNHGCHDSREKARRQQRALYRAERLNTSVVGDTVMETAKESMETMAEHSYEIRMKDGKHCVHESGTSTPVEGA